MDNMARKLWEWHREVLQENLDVNKVITSYPEGDNVKTVTTLRGGKVEVLTFTDCTAECENPVTRFFG